MNATTATHARTAATWITRIAYAIAGIGVIASYSTQVGLLADHNVGAFSMVIPATIDLLAIAATMALQLPSLDRFSRWVAGVLLVLVVGVSVSANVMGGTNNIERAAHAWPVLAYLAGELLANRVRAYAARLECLVEAASRRSESAKVGAAKRTANKSVKGLTPAQRGAATRKANKAKAAAALAPIPTFVPATA